jgi:hypothetical protein
MRIFMRQLLAVDASIASQEGLPVPSRGPGDEGSPMFLVAVVGVIVLSSILLLCGGGKNSDKSQPNYISGPTGPTGTAPTETTTTTDTHPGQHSGSQGHNHLEVGPGALVIQRKHVGLVASSHLPPPELAALTMLVQACCSWRESFLLAHRIVSSRGNARRCTRE